MWFIFTWNLQGYSTPHSVHSFSSFHPPSPQWGSRSPRRSTAHSASPGTPPRPGEATPWSWEDLEKFSQKHGWFFSDQQMDQHMDQQISWWIIFRDFLWSWRWYLTKYDHVDKREWNSCATWMMIWDDSPHFRSFCVSEGTGLGHWHIYIL